MKRKSYNTVTKYEYFTEMWIDTEGRYNDSLFT